MFLLWHSIILVPSLLNWKMSLAHFAGVAWE